MMILQNTRVHIEILEPGTAYTRTRFDWTGACRQITLDGRINYCSQEAVGDNKGTEGIGLCNEFGIHTPIGYDDTAVGDYFPKIGIGFLKELTIILMPLCVTTRWNRQATAMSSYQTTHSYSRKAPIAMAGVGSFVKH